MENLMVQWNYFGANQHGLVEYSNTESDGPETEGDGTEFVQAVPVSKAVAQLLVSHGINSGS